VRHEREATVAPIDMTRERFAMRLRASRALGDVNIDFGASADENGHVADQCREQEEED